MSGLYTIAKHMKKKLYICLLSMLTLLCCCKVHYDTAPHILYKDELYFCRSRFTENLPESPKYSEEGVVTLEMTEETEWQRCPIYRSQNDGIGFYIYLEGSGYLYFEKEKP